MKEVVAIIQMDKMESTNDALAAIGIPSFTAYKVYGRGAQRGLRIAYPSDSIAYPSDSEVKGGRTIRYLPKRMLSIVVDDKFVPAVVAVITKVNKTGNIGDGRIFVSPVEESIQIRTGERGPEALL